MDNAINEKTEIDELVADYAKIAELVMETAETFSFKGTILMARGYRDAAIDCYKHAIKIKPDFINSYLNMGIAQNKKGDREAAIDSFKQALKIKPDDAEAYFNIGSVLQNKGEYDAAIDSCKKAIKIKPDFAEAYNNMGNALNDRGELGAAIDSYKQAIKIKPDFAEVYWNLHGTSADIAEAKNWLKNCLKSDDSHVLARLTLAALSFYEGNEKDFDTLINSSLWDHPYTRSFSWVFSLPELPKLYFARWKMFDFIAERAIQSRPFYEYGVWRGEAFRYLIKTFKKGYGFDTFEGLPEDWHTEKAGSYSSDGKMPEIDGGEFVVGKFEDTLPEFFSVQRPMASVINFDADLYSSTICALNYSKSVIDTNTILVFDEFIINKYWEEDEYKALEKFCSENKFNYEVLAVSFFTKQVAVKLIKEL
jgi:tetratricopeptide (TPR) repeat protein